METLHFSPVILITLYQAVEKHWLMEQAIKLKALVTNCRSVQVQHRYEKFAPTEVLLGDEISHTTVSERGLNYHIEFGKAQNTGIFLDMSNGRKWLREQALGKNVLNLFAYTCAFSLSAIAGGASKAVNIDLSKASLSKGRENHQLNHLAKKDGKPIFRHNLSKILNITNSSRALDVQITRLRNKIEKNKKFPTYIQTVRGRGYVLKIE